MHREITTKTCGLYGINHSKTRLISLSWRRALHIRISANNTANKRKKGALHRPRARKPASKRIASVHEPRTGGDTIRRAAGRAAHENAVRRGGLEASEGRRDRALQERDKSRELAVNAA